MALTKYRNLINMEKMSSAETKEPDLADLLNRIQAYAECNRGAMMELARALGKAPPKITEWVKTREYEPSGEVTLKMLNWINAKEMKMRRDTEALIVYRDALERVRRERE